MAAAVTAPVLAGYVFLEWRGARVGTNASYDAFKLFTGFYSGMLPAVFWGGTLRWSRRPTEWLGGRGVAPRGWGLVCSHAAPRSARRKSARAPESAAA